MEVKVKRPRGRPRKRKRPEDEDSAADVKLDSGRDKRRGIVIEAKPVALVGKYVLKEFEGSGIYLGKIVYYDSGLYRVDYEDGDCEDLDSSELRSFVLSDDDFDDDLRRRRKKLNDKVLKKSVMRDSIPEKKVVDSKSDVHKIELPALSELSGGLTVEDDDELVEGDGDSSSDSCEHVRGAIVGRDAEVMHLPPLQLPPSSGTIAVPEEYVQHLLSVYGFLRSFGLRLFLGPFGLDDFVGSLNCCVPNTLLDAVHLSLMRVLRRHLETLSSDGSRSASDCLRSIDWSLLDSLTWPVHLLQYLTLMGYIKGPEWEGFYKDVLEREYYSLPVGRKLINLQILCDDVLDSVEIRAEIDMREELEVGIDPDAVASNTTENGPRRVHPRYSKTSACKNREDVEIIAESGVIRSSRETKHIDFKGTQGNVDPHNVGGDGNGDECRICGMDGTLLCCDGCPSAYHTRCIGVSKMSIPEGSWYCPECKINKISPTITVGTTLRGAKLFGTDIYGQVFMATCNHLLVFNASSNIMPYCKYYNVVDIPKVVQVLLSSVQHLSMYSEICKAILQYWALPESLFSCEMNERGSDATNFKTEELPGLLSNPVVNNCDKAASMVNVENASSNNEKNVDRVTVSYPYTYADTLNKTDVSDVKNNAVTMTEKTKDFPELTMMLPDRIKIESGLSTGSGNLPADPSDASHLSLVERSSEELTGEIKMESGMSSCSATLPESSDVTHHKLVNRINVKLFRPTKVDPVMSTGSPTLQADPSDVTHQSILDRSSVMDLMTCTSGTSKASFSGHASSNVTANTFSRSSKEDHHSVSQSFLRNSICTDVYTGSLFKPQAYINQYMHGDFAASAAANWAVVSSEESHVSESHKQSSARKITSGNVPLQMKAFSLTASRFFWPCSEKKLWEVPRERCSWCHSCKAQVVSKRGCMLNSAIIVATKSAIKILNGLQFSKIGEGNLSAISTYILILEESLHGLISGPFLSASYRNKWRKLVEGPSTFDSVKGLLLELEKNISLIVLSGEWVKPMDDRVGESSVIQSVASNVGTLQKRGLGGKRGRKLSTTSEVLADDESNQGFNWWRGGEITKFIFQKEILPRAMVRKAARQGGKRKIFGVSYVDGLDISKRSRQIIWRTAVERTKNASQLALQVRYLDLHVRWSDLVRPEQTPQDGKGQETEASAFRNAVICDKKIVENKTRYGVIFGNQKHLPSRVMKNCIEKEQSLDGKEKFWFLDSRIPLYLIKEYEENVNKETLPSMNKLLTEFSELQKKQLKASRSDTFSYLVCKRDKMEKCACASCQRDVLLGNAVTCNECQGFCHEGCTLRSVYTNRVTHVITCKLCYQAKVFTPTKIRSEPSITPLPSHRQEFHSAPPIEKSIKSSSKSSVSLSAQKTGSVKKVASSSSLASKNRSRSRTLSWGVIWKKKNNEDTGVDFRRMNILLKGSNVHHLKPVCGLCKRPYDPDLMYIHCEGCKRWFHAEALELEESKLSDVVGFKCCKCRRIGGPDCPYMNTEQIEQKRKKQSNRAPKQGTVKPNIDSGSICESECKPATPRFSTEQVFVPEEDPLLFSLSRVELVTQQNSGMQLEWDSASVPGPQKLPVRRHVKCEGDDGFGGNDLSQVDMQFENHEVVKPEAEPLVPCVEWDASTNALDDTMMLDDCEILNYEEMEFEPQTYFSLAELLDDSGQLDSGVDASGFVSGNQEDFSYTATQDGQCEYSGANKQPEFAVSAVNTVPCSICANIEPVPELSCKVCGLSIHLHCSPWDESSQMEGSCWSCGYCREWR